MFEICFNNLPHHFEYGASPEDVQQLQDEEEEVEEVVSGVGGANLQRFHHGHVQHNARKQHQPGN